MRSSLSLCKLSTFRIRDDVDATEAMPMESGEGSPGIVSDPGISELVSVAKRATPYMFADAERIGKLIITSFLS